MIVSAHLKGHTVTENHHSDYKCLYKLIIKTLRIYVFHENGCNSWQL